MTTMKKEEEEREPSDKLRRRQSGQRSVRKKKKSGERKRKSCGRSCMVSETLYTNLFQQETYVHPFSCVRVTAISHKECQNLALASKSFSRVCPLATLNISNKQAKRNMITKPQKNMPKDTRWHSGVFFSFCLALALAVPTIYVNPQGTETSRCLSSPLCNPIT